MIRRLQEKGQAEQQQTDALVDFIQDELTIDAMKKVAPILPVKENMQMGMGAIQNFAPITQSDASVLQRLLDENKEKAIRALERRQDEPLMNLPFYPPKEDIDLEKLEKKMPFNLLQGQNTSPLDYIQKLPMRKFDNGAIQNFAPITQKSMEMIRKNQTMNPTILKARGM